MGPPLSWYAIEPGWRVASRDGRSMGDVVELLADEELDIFSGLVVDVGGGRLRRYADAELVREIEQGEITLDVPAEDADRLPIWSG